MHNRFLKNLSGIFKKSFNRLSKCWCYGIFEKTVLSNFEAIGTGQTGHFKIEKIQFKKSH